MLQPEEGEEERGAEDDAHSTPAVEGMQQAHHAFLVGERACLDDGAAQHFDKTAAYRIDADAEQDAHQGIGKELRHEGQAGKAEG